MESNKTVDVYWWLLKYFNGYQMYYCLDFRKSAEKIENYVGFNVLYYISEGSLLFKGDNFIPEGISKSLSLNNIKLNALSKREFSIDLRDELASNACVKLKGHCTMILTPLIEEKLKNITFTGLLNMVLPDTPPEDMLSKSKEARKIVNSLFNNL
jgi:hypothetical protein